jgi:hypothetical protein
MIELAIIAGVSLFAILFTAWLFVRVIGNDEVGIVERCWSSSGSLKEGDIISLKGEGFAAWAAARFVCLTRVSRRKKSPSARTDGCGVASGGRYTSPRFFWRKHDCYAC